MKKLFFGILCIISHTTFANNLGETTYKIACGNCHSPKLASSIGAPPAFNKKEWRRRYKDAKIASKKYPEKYSSPVDYLLQQVKKGKGFMQHGGLCNEAHVKDKNCSDEALIAAINYMSKPK